MTAVTTLTVEGDDDRGNVLTDTLRLIDVSVDTHGGEGQLEVWLGALADIGEAVGGDTPVEAVLDRVAETACTLLGYDFCAVFLPTTDRSALTIVGSHGLSPDYVAQVNADRPILLDVRDEYEAPTSIAFRTGEVVTVDDIDRKPHFTWSGVAHEQGYRALISVPLRRSGTVVGALNGYRAGPHRFDRAEVGLVSTLATQVAVALGTAQLRAAEQATITELRRAAEVHTLLTETALRGEGVTGVAEALAELLGRSVVIDDVYAEQLAAAGPASTTEATNDERLREEPAAGDERLREEPRASVTDVILDGAPVAHIRVAATDDPLSAVDVRAIEQAAVVTALELLRARTAAEVEQRLRGSLVADVLGSDPGSLPAIVDRARRLGWDLAGTQTLIGLRCNDTEALLAAADRFFRHATQRPLSAVHRGDVILLWPSGAAVETTRRLVDTVAMTGVIAAVSRTVDAAGLPATFRAVRGALDLAAGAGAPAVIDLTQLTVDQLLLELGDTARLTEFATSVLGRAMDYDRTRSTALLDTARVVIDAGLDRRAAATRLHLHHNTVAQRMRRLEELTGLAMSRPADLLQLTSALTVARIAALG
ncbi:fused phosphoenolpyruvate-protein phosphotransferase PtsP/GAF domain protein [Mycolicibacterium obuense]|uniref:Fused phosphoenolpyruvate-protein phosphotransferase PtsP/GAF domain protein n=1 Tax=Mycolicibacterium obuense TaxID=1807 RepID=A0A0J6W5Y7_9MYCO|nr:fused phosphoenolpyruvate-protein phosphotransferase PtsP/GAF domain protein [Mycolicibacterium obuense]